MSAATVAMVAIEHRGERIEARRPTHAECDIAAIGRLCGMAVRAQEAAARASEVLDVDGLERASATFNKTADRVRARVATTIRAIAPQAGAAVVARIEADDAGGASLQEAIDIFGALCRALGVDESSLGKS